MKEILIDTLGSSYTFITIVDKTIVQYIITVISRDGNNLLYCSKISSQELLVYARRCSRLAMSGFFCKICSSDSILRHLKPHYRRNQLYIIIHVTKDTDYNVHSLVQLYNI